MQGVEFLRRRAETQEQWARHAEDVAALADEQRAIEPSEAMSAAYAEWASFLSQAAEGGMGGYISPGVVVLGGPVSL